MLRSGLIPGSLELSLVPIAIFQRVLRTLKGPLKEKYGKT